MSEDSKQDFIACVKKSGVIDTARLSKWLKNATGEEPRDLAKQLVRDELLTKWQAKYLMSGRTRLDIGNYRLLERTSRDELGDRFLAVHTTLARKVDLQVLPSEVTKDETQIKAFLKKASEVGKLDHPNLIHVYDIDQEGGRFFLVTEFVEGNSLDQVARSKIKLIDIARILSQSVTGLTHAHENEVIHGSLTQNDLVLVADNIKIQNLAVSPLRQNSTSEIADDFDALKNIGMTLLGDLPDSKQSDLHAELTTLLTELKPESPDSISSLSDSLVALTNASAPEPEFDFLALSTDTQPASGGFDQPIASALPTRKKKKPPIPEVEPELAEEDESTGVLGRLWRDNPVAAIATAGVLTLLLLTGISFAAYNLLSGKNNSIATKNTAASSPPVITQETVDFSDEEKMKKLIDAQFNNEEQSTKDQPNGSSAVTDASKFKFPRLKSECKIGPKDKPITIPAETAVKTISPQSSEGWIEIEAVLSDNSKVNGWIESKFIYDDPKSAPTLVADKTNDTAPKTPPPKTEATPSDPAQSKPDETTASTNPQPKPPTAENLTVIRGIAEATQAVLRKGNVLTLKQLASMSGEEVREALRKGGKKFRLNGVGECEDWISQAKKLTNDTSAVRKTTPSTSTAAGGTTPNKPNIRTPFENFPRITQLPPVENTTEKLIAPLAINQAYLLGAEIVSDPGICRTKVIFELNRTVDDKQKWIVGVKRRPKEKPTELAQFRKSKDAFFFQWLPEATNNKYSEFLRNCFVKLATPDGEAAYLALRTPIKAPDLRLTAGSLTNSLELIIPALPNPDNIVVEVLPVRVPGLELDTVVSVVERGSPGRIMLMKRDSKGFMWIQVSGELKSKLKLQANVMARFQNKIFSLTDMNDVGKFAGTLKQSENVAIRANQQKQSQVAPQGKKTVVDQEKAQFQAFANQAKAATNKVIQYQSILAKTMNAPIKIRIFAKFGTLKIQLVETDPNLPQPPKKKKK
ncbi:MAG: protein kinase [Mariniblastus sp.]|nr:protein kinase [Mariniblastus sp.]